MIIVCKYYIRIRVKYLYVFICSDISKSCEKAHKSFLLDDLCVHVILYIMHLLIPKMIII
jgi:hypothetical protein